MIPVSRDYLKRCPIVLLLVVCAVFAWIDAVNWMLDWKLKSDTATRIRELQQVVDSMSTNQPKIIGL